VCYVQVLDAKGSVKAILSEDEIMKGFLKYGYDGKIGQIVDSHINFK
jgi:hypothetical protein